MRRPFVWLVLCAAWLSFQPTKSNAATVHEWAEGFARPTLSGTGVDAARRTLAFGHLRLSECRGRLYPVVALDRLVGAFLDGTALLTYVSADPLERASYGTNVRRVTPWEIDAEGALRTPVESFLVMLSTGADALGGGPEWREGTPPAEAVAAFAKHLERFANDRAPRYSQLMPQAMVDPPAQPLVIAEVSNDKRDLGYLLDPLRDHDEALWTLKESRFAERFEKDRRYPQLLSLQPVGRSRLEPRPRRFVLKNVDVTVVNPAGMKLEAEARETFAAVVPIDTLELSLWSARVITEGAGGTPDEHEVTLHRVTLADGTPLVFSHVNDDLVVQLPRTLRAGEEVALTFSYSGDVLYRPGGDSYWELPTEAWFPCPARLEMQCFTYHAVVKVAKPFVAFSCGKTVRRWEEGELACAEFNEELPIQIPVVLAGKYLTAERERQGVKVEIASYAMADTRATETLFKNILGLIEFYTFYLGPYPFSELKLIEINSYGFGQAPAGVIFITKEAFSPLQDEMTRLFSENVNARVAHEMAHTWWGHVVKLGAPEDQWLSESVAEYYSAYAMGKLWHASKFDKALGEWRGNSKFIKDRSSVYLASQLSGEEAYEDRFGLLYAKGPLVLHALRQELGDNGFFTVLKSFVTNSRFKPGETRHFIGVTNFVTKKEMTPFFERYLLGTEWPKL